MNPKQKIAVLLAERKKTLGPMPKNPMAPSNAITSTPNLVPPSNISPISNPMAPASTSLVSPKLPGMGRFGRIKKMF